MVNKDPPHIRKEIGQMRTLEGRQAVEHEHFVTKVVGRNWTDLLDTCASCENWVEETRPYLDEYLAKKAFRQTQRTLTRF